MRQSPTCGRESSALLSSCPSCGQPLVALEPPLAAPPADVTHETPAERTPSSPVTGAEQQPAPPYPGYPGYAGYPPYGPYTPYPGYPPYPPPGYPAMPQGMPTNYPGGYSAGYPASLAPASMPPYPPYPAYPYHYPYGYPAPVPPSVQLAPAPAAKPAKKGLWVWLSVALAVVVILALVIAGLALATGNHPNTIGNVSPAASPISTSMPAATATPGSNTPFRDPLTSNVNGWTTDNHCFFRSDGYHIVGAWNCYPSFQMPSDFKMSVQMKAISGPQNVPYGIVFRGDNTGAYYFNIAADGWWTLFDCDSSSCKDVIPWSTSSAIVTGLNARNTLTVAAQGSHFTFFINGINVGQASGTTYSGAWAGLSGGDTMEVVFTNLEVDLLSS